jgi:CHASE2 domain-containing sensor protein
MPARLVRSELRSDDVVLLGIVFVAAVLVVCGAAMLFRSRVAAVVALVVTALAACLFLFLFLWMFLGPIPLLVLPVLAYLLAAGLALSKRDATGR